MPSAPAHGRSEAGAPSFGRLRARATPRWTRASLRRLISTSTSALATTARLLFLSSILSTRNGQQAEGLKRLWQDVDVHVLARSQVCCRVTAAATTAPPREPRGTLDSSKRRTHDLTHLPSQRLVRVPLAQLRDLEGPRTPSHLRAGSRAVGHVLGRSRRLRRL